MTDFKAINQDAAASDKPMHSALMQGIRNNTIAAREKRLRSMTKSYDLRVISSTNVDRPRIHGTYSWNTPELRVYGCLPFLYVRTRPDVTQIKVLVAGVQTDTAGSLAAAVVKIEDAILGAWTGFREFPDDASASNTAISAGASTQEDSFTLTLPATTGDVFMVFFGARSDLDGTVTEIQDSVAANAMYAATYGALRRKVGGAVIQYNFNSNHTETTQRPDFCVGFDSGAGKASWPQSGLKPSRQAIFIDDGGSFRGVYVYPPYDENIEYGLPNTARLFKNPTGFYDLESIQIVEVAETGFVFDSALNGGKAASIETHSRLVVEAEKLPLRYVPAYHCGGNVAPNTTDHVLDNIGALAGTGAYGSINKLHNYVEYTASWQTIGQCTVRPHGTHKTLDGTTTQTRVGYRAVAVFAISAASSLDFSRRTIEVSPPATFDLDVKLILTDRNASGTSVVGGAQAYNKVPANAHPVGLQTEAVRALSEPVGYLLRLHHIDDIDTDQEVNELVSHTLAGQFPDDVWSSGRYLFVDLEIIDTETDPERLLTIQVRGNSDDVPNTGWAGTGTAAANAYVHLLTWTVVGFSPPSSYTVGDSSV